jgi:hypothetical protein
MPGILERGAAFSIASYFLRFESVYEAEADLLGAQLAATAGYDPAAVNDMFRQLNTAGAAHGGLHWLMRHPNRRVEASDRIAKAPSAEFQSLQVRVVAIPRPERSVANLPATGSPVATIGAHVPTPEGGFRSVTAGDQLLLSVPANWNRLLIGNTATFAPEGAYEALQDGPAFMTHGFQVGIARSITGALNGDMPALLSALARNNPKFTWVPAFQQIRVAGRDALTTTASNVSPVTDDFETVAVTVLLVSDDTLLYFLGVAPQQESSTYRGVFEGAVQSLFVFD